MGASRKRGPASAPAQPTEPDVVVTLAVMLTANRDEPNTAHIDVKLDVDASAVICKMIRAAYERGDLRPSMDQFADAVGRALGPQEAPVSAGKAGRA